MNRTLLLGITFFLALVGLSLTGDKNQAVAGHGCHGCHGCYGGYGGYVSYGCHGCWGRPFVVRHRFIRRGCFGYYDCYGCGGCYGGLDCRGGWRVIERDTAHTVEAYHVIPNQPMPTVEPQEGAEPSDEPPLPPVAAEPDDQVRYAPSPSSVLMGVRVPPQAKVFVNGRQTRSTGGRRWYTSSGLHAGRAYTYEVRVELARGEETLVVTKQVRIRSGQRAELEFRFEPSQTARRPSNDPPRTTLILRVPHDAKVLLAGRETKGSGLVREFSTRKLTGEGQWANYPVRVELERDGETLVQERTVTLAAGQTREVTFHFDVPQATQALADTGR